MSVANGGTGNTTGAAVSAQTATTAEKLGSSNVGSGTKPIYLSSGTATASSSTVGNSSVPVYLSSGTITQGSTYAGGTRVTLNGTTRASSNATFYAPTSAGTSGYILKSAGTGAPTWLSTLPIANGGTGATTAAAALANLGGIGIDLLWTNSSPTSSFAAQTISSDDWSVSDYDLIYVSFSQHTSYPRVRIGALGVVEVGISENLYYYTGSSSYWRSFFGGGSSSTEIGIKFTDGSSGSSTNNNVLIPQSIYGIKGVN